MSEKITLRPHQRKAVDEVLAALAFGSEDIFLSAPPAFGKSLVLATLANELEGNIVIMVNITPLLDQIAEHADLINMDYSILKAGRESEFEEGHHTNLVMSQTYYARADKLNIKCDYLLIDEGHREFDTERTQKLINTLRPKGIIRVSGTPWDQAGFAFPRTELIDTISVLDLEKLGYLSKIKYFVPKWSEMIDYSGIKKKGNDYSANDLDSIVNTTSHIKKSIEAMNLLELKAKKGLVFCSTIEQCDNVARMLKDAGYAAEAYHSKINKKLGDAILTAFKTNTEYDIAADQDKPDAGLFDEESVATTKPVKCLVSVSRLGVGFDSPDSEYGVMFRKTAVLSLYIQMVMRLARTHPDKDHAILLDLSQNLNTHGFHWQHYSPLARTTDHVSDKNKMEKLRTARSMQFLQYAINEPEAPQEIDYDAYQVQVKKMEAREAKVRAKEEDLMNWKVPDLASLFESTQDFTIVIAAGAAIYTKKSGKPISKAGFEYDYNPEWIAEDIETKLQEFPEIRAKSLRAYKTRARNIIKQGKNYNALKFFIDFLINNHKDEQISVVDEFRKNNVVPDIDIDEDSIPF